jgi:FkbM family methyltransferase
LLLDLETLVAEHRLVVDEVLHIGAHHGQEADTYRALGAKRVTWVEANPAVVPLLRQNVEPLGHSVITALVTDHTGDTVDFHVTNNEQSSSVLNLGTHRYEHPEVVVTASLQLRTTTLDDLCEREGVPTPDLLVMDVQGAEMLVLRGAQRILEGVGCIYAEVNERPVYAGAALLPAFDSYLSDRGFDRVSTTLTVHGWGDALYVRRKSAMAVTPEEVGTPRRGGRARILRRRAGDRARAVVGGAVDPRFDAVQEELGQLTHRLTTVEHMLVHNELEVAALRQQVDECLDFLRLQHTIVRDLLEELRPLLGPHDR